MPYTQNNHQEYTRYLDLLKGDFVKKYQETQVYQYGLADYDSIKVIGTGAYGEVFLVRNKCTLSYHAMKVVEKAVVVERKHVDHLIHEKKILESIQFPFLISISSAFKDNVYLYLVLPYLPGGELFTVMQNYGSFSDDVAKFYISQMVLAVEYLHYCQIVHRDIKPENILIEINGYLKLCDFGFGKVISKKTWTLCGTPEYLAPEVITSKGYTFSVDYWALGVLIYEMTVGYPPFYAAKPDKLYEKVLSGQYKCPDEISQECKSLIKAFLQVDPLKRLGSFKGGVYDIKSHPWFSDINWQCILNQSLEAPILPVCASPGDTRNFPEMPSQKLKHSEYCQYSDEFKDF